MQRQLPSEVITIENLIFCLLVYLMWTRRDFQVEFDFEFCFCLKDDVHVVPCGDHGLGPGVIPDVDHSDETGVGVRAVTDLQGGALKVGSSQVGLR